MVIRTDLLYEAEGFGEFAPGKTRKRKLVSGAGEEGKGDGINKVAKVVAEDSAGHTKQVGEVVVPVAVGTQHAGDGVEGIGG